MLAEEFCRGLAAHGDEGVIETRDFTHQAVEFGEVAAFVGIKSDKIYRASRAAGAHTILFDKGYERWGRKGGMYKYWRVAIDGHHPTKALMDIKRPHDRLRAQKFKIKPWREDGKYILLAGSSAKYHRFYDLPEPTEWAQRVAKELWVHTGREVLYRPKKSWKDAVHINGTVWGRSRSRIEEQLEYAWALVTYGSNSCYEAILQGVPCITLGDAVARPISSTSLSEIEDPYLATMDERQQWLANLMYQQWTLVEYGSGQAWAALKPQIVGSA